MVANLRALRLQRQLTQQELGLRAGLDGPRISELENGRGNPTLATLQQIADALGADLRDLFGSVETQQTEFEEIISGLASLDPDDRDLLWRLAQRLRRSPKA